MDHSWAQVLSLFLANAALVIWLRSESRNDWRHMDAKVDANLHAIREEIKAFQTAMYEENKDFHGRLCKIEESRKKT